MINSGLAIYLIIIGWVLLYNVLHIIMLHIIESDKKSTIKRWGRTSKDYEYEKWTVTFYLRMFFIGIPLLFILLVIQDICEEKGIVPFSSNVWIVGSIIVGAIWVALFIAIYLTGMRRIELLQKNKEKKRAKKSEDYDEKKWNLIFYVLGLGIGIPVIVVIALLSM